MRRQLPRKNRLDTAASPAGRFGMIDAFNRYAYGVDPADGALLASAITSTEVIEWSGTGELKGGGGRRTDHPVGDPVCRESAHGWQYHGACRR